MTDLTIDGETFRVEVEGDPTRPVLLLSSSLGGDLSMWDAQMPAFLAQFRVVRYDPRGHGDSTRIGAPYSLARLGADALAILDALEIERAHFLGISMGGVVGQWLLVNAPERIARAVLANTSAKLGTPEVWNERIRTVLAHGTAALAAGTMERWFSKEFRDREAARVAAIDKVFQATSAEGYAASCAALRDMDMREALQAIDRPVLVVTGRDDQVTSATDIATMLAAIPGAQHLELECKHISNIEAQADFDAAVVAFLTARTPARRTREPKKAAAKPATRRLARHGTSARSPLKPARPAATPSRRRPAAKSARTEPAGAEPKRTTASPRQTARPAATRRVSPVAARAPVAKAAAAKTPARKAKPTVAKGPVKPRRSPAVSAATRKAVAAKAVTKKAVTNKPVAKTPVAEKSATKTSAAKKPIAKKAPAKSAVKKAVAGKSATKVKVPAKTAARRPTKKRPARPGARARR